jgi:hypothetical protein
MHRCRSWQSRGGHSTFLHALRRKACCSIPGCGRTRLSRGPRRNRRRPTSSLVSHGRDHMAPVLCARERNDRRHLRALTGSVAGTAERRADEQRRFTAGRGVDDRWPTHATAASLTVDDGPMGEPAGFVIRLEDSRTICYAGDVPLRRHAAHCRALQTRDRVSAIGDRFTMDPIDAARVPDARSAARRADTLGTFPISPAHRRNSSVSLSRRGFACWR